MNYTKFKDENEIEKYFKNNISYYRYGSTDSIDKDVIVFVEDVSDKQYYRELGYYATKYLGIEINFCVIKEGRIIDSLKGVPDSVNNSLYYTFSLHPENEGEVNPIWSPTSDIVEMKYVEAIRTCLAFISRTRYRESVKPALSSRCQKLRNETLLNIDLSTIDDDLEDRDTINQNNLKSMVFVMSQAYLLLYGHSNVFCKDILIKNMPCNIKPILSRRYDQSNMTILNNLKDGLIKMFNQKYRVTKIDYHDCNNHINLFTPKEWKKNNNLVSICLLKERVIKND